MAYTLTTTNPITVYPHNLVTIENKSAINVTKKKHPITP